MTGKSKFDSQSAFMNIIGSNNNEDEKNEKKGRPKVDREIKKRISVAIYPSVYEDFQKIAYVDRRSVSDIICQLMNEFVESNIDKIDEYDKIKNT